MQRSSVKSGLLVLLPVLLGAAPVLTALWFILFTDMSDAASKDPFRFNVLFQIAVLLGAILLGFSRETLPKGRPLEYGLLGVFLVSAVLGLMFEALDPRFGASSLAFRLFSLVLSVMLIFVIRSVGEPLSTRLITALLVGFTAHAALVLATIPIMPPYPHYDFLHGPPGMFHVRLWGIALVGVIGAGIGLSLNATGLRRLLLWTLVTLLMTAMFWSGTRGGIMALPGAAVFGLMVLTRSTLRMLPILAFSLLVGGGLSLLLEPPAPSWGMLNSYVETAQAQTANALTAGRITLWWETLRLITEAPWIGHGYDQFRWLEQSPGRFFTHPHNSPLHILVSFGVIGGTSLIAFVVILWIRAIRNVRANPTPVMHGALFGLNALLIFSLVDAVFYHTDPLILMAVFFAILLASPRPSDAR